MLPDTPGDAYRLLLQIVPALDGFIDCTGPNGHPRLAEAIDAGESGADEVVYAVWCAARWLVEVMPQVSYPYKATTTDEMGLKLVAALACLHGMMKKLLDRWEFPTDVLDGGVSFQSGMYRAAGDTEGMWNPIIPPIVEPAEHAVLEWCRNEFAKVGRGLDSRGWGQPASQSLQIEGPRVEPEPRPVVRPGAALGVADRVRAALKRVRAAEAKALEAGAKPSGKPKETPLGPGEVYTSLRKLAAIFPCGADSDAPNRLRRDGLIGSCRHESPKKQKRLIVTPGPNATEDQRAKLTTKAKKKPSSKGRKKESPDDIP